MWKWYHIKEETTNYVKQKQIVLNENKGTLIQIEIRRQVHCESATVVSRLVSLKRPKGTVQKRRLQNVVLGSTNLYPTMNSG